MEILLIDLVLDELLDVEGDFSSLFSFSFLNTVILSALFVSRFADLLLEATLVLLRAGESTTLLSVGGGLSSKGTESTTLCLSTEDKEL